MYYAVRVTSRKEDYIIALIKERIDNNLFNDVFSPTRLVSRKYKGEWKDDEETLFPGYIFVDTDNPKELSAALIRIPQYARILGREESSGGFVPLTNEECYTIDRLCGRDSEYKVFISDVTFTEGKQIKVVSGPLMGLEGCITKVDLHKKIVFVKLSMCGQASIVKMGINLIVEKNN